MTLMSCTVHNTQYYGYFYYRGLFNLVTHGDKVSSQMRMTILIRSFVLLKCLEVAGYFKSSDMEDELTWERNFIGSLLYHFQAGIQYNLHAIYQVKP